MQDPELTQNEFRQDLKPDSLEFDFETSDEFDLEAWGESPQDEASGMSIANAIGKRAMIGPAHKVVAQPGAAARRQQSGRCVRHGNHVVLGI
jgi:hypothetical protein